MSHPLNQTSFEANGQRMFSSQVSHQHQSFLRLSHNANDPSGRPTLVNPVQNKGARYKSVNHLPKWITETSEIPKVYRVACSLVEDKEGWIHTKRAYMLLLKTNVPPHYLGILWEMVNRTQPGVLKVSEFRELLALVALLQKGSTFANADVLLTQIDPVYPLIDHPVLLPLVEVELKKKNEKSAKNCLILEEDEFAEFVSAVALPMQQHPSVPTIKEPTFPTAFLSKKQNLDKFDHPPPITPHPVIPSHNTLCNLGTNISENKHTHNLPRLGNSPLGLQIDATEPSDCCFNDFQTAPIDSQPKSNSQKLPFLHLESHNARPIIVTNSNNVPQSNAKSEKLLNSPLDKYAAFREFSGNDEDSFGEFLSSTCMPSNTEIVQKDFVEIEEPNTVTDWDKDAFGQFESHHKFDVFPTNFSADTNQNIIASTSGDDDFGDFIGPSPAIFPQVPVETISVNSLELPDLEMTVNLTPEKYESSTPNKTLFEEEFNSLSPIPISIENNDFVQSPLVTQTKGSTTLIDKYCLLKEEETKTSLSGQYIDPWKKCLQGCLKLLQEATVILRTIQDSSFLEQILGTSQMQDYLANLLEVNRVRQRIETSSKCQNFTLTLTVDINESLLSVETLWNSLPILGGSEVEATTKGDNGEGVCSVCLLNDGASLVYGSRTYHPACANLWLNTVHCTLPTL